MAKKIGVLTGRFQGYHYFHHEHVKRAAMESDILIIIVGSRNRRRSIKNPWTAEERIEMIEANVQADAELNSCRIIYRMANDHPDNNVWADSIRQTVGQLVNENTVVTLYGTDKDATTFYLHMFPEWQVELSPIRNVFDATKLRELWFKGMQGTKFLFGAVWVPDATVAFLEKQEFNEDLQGEWNYYLKEREMFSGYPFPETLNFNCGDAVLMCHGMVAMIRRANNPGKGCLALPGGFKNRDETFFEAAVRELYEETTLDIPRNHLTHCLVKTQLFDNPSRSIGIPRNTLAALFDVTKYYLPGEYPYTKAADDAAEVEWVATRDLLYRTDTYDDHAGIVTTMLTKEV